MNKCFLSEVMVIFTYCCFIFPDTFFLSSIGCIHFAILCTQDFSFCMTAMFFRDIKMYGLLLEGILQAIKKKYGEKAWLQVYL